MTDAALDALRRNLVILADVDGYIAQGGRLGDLPLILPTKRTRAFDKAMERLGTRVLTRLGRFYQRVGEACGDDRLVKDLLTEEQLRDIWRAGGS